MSATALVLLGLTLCALLYVLRDALLLKRAQAKKLFRIEFSPDDPLMKAAAEKARATLPEFEKLQQEYPHHASLALGPIGPKGQMTPVLLRGRAADGYLVKRARNRADGSAAEYGPEFVCRVPDIVDWIVFESEKKDRVHGGFTMRALLAIARRDGKELPPHVLEQEKKFVG